MRTFSLSKMVLVVCVFCAAMTIVASAQTLTTITNFNNTDGYQPESPLVQSTDGNFYGVTFYGGTPTSCPLGGGVYCGTFFRMSPAGDVTTLYNFCTQSKCADGGNPDSLIQASDGNFYGTTFIGGASTSCSGCGTIFRMTPTGQLTTLHTFCLQSGCPDGDHPSTLIQATDGNLYGSASGGGGAQFAGTLFQLTPTGKFTILYTFCAQANCADGGAPDNLMQASDGNLYGTGTYGGTYNGGMLFRVTPAGQVTSLLSLRKPGRLIQGTDGSLYGTTAAGGTSDHGTVFRVSPSGQLTTLHNFCGLSCPTGDSPISGVVQGSDGNLYGSTYYGGNTYYAGSLFQITPTGGFNTLYIFCAETNCTDGWGPGALTQFTDGTFYGATSGGGATNNGTIFTLSMGLGSFVAARPNFGAAGRSITILGSGFTGTTSVTFNGTPATFAVVSDTYIQAQVPEGATTGSIVVTTPNGSIASNLPFRIQ